MDNSFKTFLQSTAVTPSTNSNIPIKSISESNKEFNSTDRVRFLKEKTEMFCKKFGEFGMDSLDTFFKENVEKMLNLKTESTVIPTKTIQTKPTNVLDYANTLMENVNPKPAASMNQNPEGNDIMARASMMLS